MRLHICWFKRDLRLDDHRALHAASFAARKDLSRGVEGRLLCLYCHEPALLGAPEHDPSHAAFVNASVRELRRGLRERGSDLAIRHADMPGALEEFSATLEIASIHAHEETGQAVTYERDRALQRWCNANGVELVEHVHTGVVRRLKTRDGWAARWRKRMDEPCLDAPDELPPMPSGVRVGRVPSLRSLGLRDSARDLAQPGGEAEGRRVLETFLHERSTNYQRAMSSPVTAAEECSRISPHLAYGNLSMRRVHQLTQRRIVDVKEERGGGAMWTKSLYSFAKRLRWHCHFMQKLEDEPSIEFRNFSRVYDGLRTEDTADWDDVERTRFGAWASGNTGYPMVDACMRCLHRTGWINFRMRAMLVSFGAYHLWLHWRPLALHLGPLFLDYEAGIHYSQHQMQSGTTGINTVRIYSPIKQVKDHDPRGVFIRRWCPELRGVPDEHLPEPWTMEPMTQDFARCRIGRDYPRPIVDHGVAYREAMSRIYALRGTKAARAEASRVQRKHGSRRGARRRAG